MLVNPRYFTKDMINYYFIWDNCENVSEVIELYVYYYDEDEEEGFCCNENNPILTKYCLGVKLDEIVQACKTQNINCFLPSSLFKFKIKKRTDTNLDDAILFPNTAINLVPLVTNINVSATLKHNEFKIEWNSFFTDFIKNIGKEIKHFNIYYAEKETPEIQWHKLNDMFIDNNPLEPLYFRSTNSTGMTLDTEYYLTLGYCLENNVDEDISYIKNSTQFSNQTVVNKIAKDITFKAFYGRTEIIDITDKQFFSIEEFAWAPSVFTILVGDLEEDGSFYPQKKLSIDENNTTYNIQQYTGMSITCSSELLAALDPNEKYHFNFYFYTIPTMQTVDFETVVSFKTSNKYAHDFEAFKGLESLKAEYNFDTHQYECEYFKFSSNNNELYVYQAFDTGYKLCNILGDNNAENLDYNILGKRRLIFTDPDSFNEDSPNRIDSYKVFVSDFAVQDREGRPMTDNISQDEIDDIIAGLDGFEFKCSLYEIANYKTNLHPEGEIKRSFIWNKMSIEKDMKTSLPILHVSGTQTEESLKSKAGNSYIFTISVPNFPSYKQEFNFNYDVSTRKWLLQNPGSTTFINADEGFLLENFVNNNYHITNTDYKVSLKAYSANQNRYKIIYEDYLPYQSFDFLKGVSYNYYPYGNKMIDKYIFHNNNNINTNLYNNLTFLPFKNQYNGSLYLSIYNIDDIDVSNFDKIKITKIETEHISGIIEASFDSDFEKSISIREGTEINVSNYEHLYLKFNRIAGTGLVIIHYTFYLSQNNKFNYGYFYNKQLLKNTNDIYFTYLNDKQNILYHNNPVYDLQNIDNINYTLNTSYDLSLQGNFQYTDFYDFYHNKPNKNFGVSITKQNVMDHVPHIMYDDSEDASNILYFGYNKNAQQNQDYTNIGLHNYDTNLIGATSKVSIFPKNSPLINDTTQEKIWLTFKITEMIQQNCIQSNVFPSFLLNIGDDDYINQWTNNKKCIKFKSDSALKKGEVTIDFKQEVCINSIQNLKAKCDKLEIRDEYDHLWYSGKNLSNEEIIFNNQKIKCKKLSLFIYDGIIQSNDLKICLLEKAADQSQPTKGFRNRTFKTDNIRLFLNTGDNLDYKQYIENGQEIQGLVLNNNQPVNFYIEDFSNLANDTLGDLIYKLELIKTEHILFDTSPNDDNIVSLVQENKNQKEFIKDFCINSYTNKLAIKNSKIKKIQFKKCQQDTLINCVLEKEERKE